MINIINDYLNYITTWEILYSKKYIIISNVHVNKRFFKVNYELISLSYDFCISLKTNLLVPSINKVHVKNFMSFYIFSTQSTGAEEYTEGSSTEV